VRRDFQLRPPCPRAARLASWLLLAVATFSALDTTMAGLALRHLNRATGAFLALPGAADQLPLLTQLRRDFVYDAVLAAIVGVAFAVLGVAVRWPSRYARWTACGSAGLLALMLPVGYLVSYGDAPTAYPADPWPVRHATVDLVLSGYPGWRLVAMLVEVAVLVAIAVKLCGADAHDYYRRLQPDGRPGLWTVPAARRASRR
jgi:hypothetical protein